MGVAIFHQSVIFVQKCLNSIHNCEKHKFHSTQGRIKLFNYLQYGFVYPTIHKLPRVPLGELNLNFLKYASRHLYKHIGEKILWKGIYSQTLA